MTKKYRVAVDSYSLNELTEKLINVVYGPKVKAAAGQVVPEFSNLVQSDPNQKGVTWIFCNKAQAKSLEDRLNILLRL